MARVNPPSSNEKALLLLCATIVGAAAIGVLYVAQRVLMPVALALFFAFLLTPVVIKFQRWGLHRVVAVLSVTLLTAALFLGFGWLVVSQMVGLAGNLPSYTENINKKIAAVRALGEDTVWSRLETMIHKLGVEPDVPEAANPKDGLTTPETPIQQPAPVVINQAEKPWLSWLASSVSPAAEFLGQVGLIIVLVVFMLLSREDLRNRFIRLIGHGRLTVTTKAVDDASQRLSRFLLVQLTINASFGLCVTLGLTLIGVDYALLWGFLIGVLRYVPYIGSPIAALFPIVLSIAQFDGWLQPALVAVLILGLELVAANVFEPWLFGHSIGVSPIALLIAAAFWAFLWGPIGLVLSCPLTVCLVVLGKYVPNLEFLTVLLGKEPALAEDFTYYHRLSAHDQDEATDIVLEHIKDHPIDEVYDSLLIPALTYAERDLQHKGLDEDDVHFVHETTREILADVEGVRQERQAAAEPPASTENLRPVPDRVRILGIPARGQSDAIALEMLRQMLEGQPCELIIAGHEVLSSELLTMIEEQAPAVVCIAAVPPGGLARARFLCKRLRSRFPELRLLVGRWGLTTTEEKQDKTLRDAGADYVRNSLVACRDDLVAWLPALAEKHHEVARCKELATCHSPPPAIK
jgi:predicted PurR-regulated permease PerM